MMIGGIAACLLISGTSALSQTAPATEAHRVAAGSVPATVATAEHPLMPVIRWAEQARPGIAAIKDYTATLRKQENIDGTLHGPQVLEIKVRHQPFSVYTRFLFPQDVAGQQAIYIEGQNNGNLRGRGVGFEWNLGWLSFPPDGIIPRRGQKYPITQIGILNLVDELLKVGRETVKFGECEVTYHEGVTLGTGPLARECTVIQVVHPVRRDNFSFHIARIFVDNELNLPIRYESYCWPTAPGETPPLIEVYTYMDLKINVGLTDADFDHTNPEYNRRP